MMRHFLCVLLLACCILPSVSAQYAPQAGISGSTAIHATNAAIKGWANHCTIYKGYMNIAQPSLGIVSAGDSSMATGAADNFVVSLGDSGVAELSFSYPITNGPGADFAVFENGFPNPADPEEAFLELAFIEVSSDGTNFFRFPSASLTQDTLQLSSVAGENYMNARHLNNLAGKYISNYGTPFDLQELDGIAGLDINSVTHVRIVDVIGSVDGHSSYDNSNRIINDPYPTPFPTGGFDLDAVGVIHQNTSASVHSNSNGTTVTVYPNPAADLITVGTAEKGKLIIFDLTGKTLLHAEIDRETQISLRYLNPGLYMLQFINTEGIKWCGRISKL